jgi:hypothetical protein
MKVILFAVATLLLLGCDGAPSDARIKDGVQTLYRQSTYVCQRTNCFACEIDPVSGFEPTQVEIVERGRPSTAQSLSFPVRVRVQGRCPPGVRAPTSTGGGRGHPECP